MDDIKLFVKNEKELESLIQTVRIFSDDIGIEFSIEKCAMLIMKRREGKELLNQGKIRTLREKETYKYLGILERDIIKQVEMKEKIKKEYLWRTKQKLLEAKQHRNIMKGINTWAISLMRYL